MFDDWFVIRKELSARRQSLLVFLSFLLPLFIWCFVSYVPWIWHPDVRIDISADSEVVSTVFTAGDRVSRDYFKDFQDSVRAENTDILRVLQEDAAYTTSRRRNKKILRHIAPIAIQHSWLTEDEAKDDLALLALWRGIDGGTLTAQLSEENRKIISYNVQQLADVKDEISKKPLLKLIPQGQLSNPDYFPAPHQVLNASWRDFSQTADSEGPPMVLRALHSAQIVFLGFIISVLIGLPLGVLCGSYDFFSKLIEPFVDFFRYMPAPTFSTLLVAIFAADDAPKVALVFVGTFFQLVLVVSNTVRGVDRALIEAAQTLGAVRLQLLTRVVVPAAMPKLFDDLRILLGWSWTWLVIAELIGVKSGLTEFIETQGRYRNFERVFPVIILIGLMGFITDQIAQRLSKHLFPWAPRR